MPRLTTASDWVPGDPLYIESDNTPAEHAYRRGGHANYLFNFRDDMDGPEPNVDAAHWPDPRGRSIGDQDELGEFIAAYRRWRVQCWVRDEMHARFPWLSYPAAVPEAS